MYHQIKDIFDLRQVMSDNSIDLSPVAYNLGSKPLQRMKEPEPEAQPSFSATERNE